MGTTAQKLEYLGTTKSQLKDMINYGLDNNNKITNSTTFRNYVSSIFNAFLEALRTPDTLFTNLPKKSGTGANITLNDTANAPMRITLAPTELSQSGTPTPSTPYPIHTISGSNKVIVLGSNILKNNATSQTINELTFVVNNDKSITVSGTPNANTNFTILGDTSVAEEVLLLKANTTYYNSTGIRLVYRLVSGGYGAIDSGIYTPTTDISIRHIYLSFTSGTSINTTYYPMINLGSTATTYTPYVSQEADIDLGELEYCKIGTYADRIFKNIVGDTDYSSERDEGAWYIKKNIGKVTNNTVTYSSNDETTNVTYFRVPKPNDYNGYNSYDRTNDNKVLYNKALYSTSGTWNSIDNIGKILSGGVLNYFMIGFTKGTTLEQAQTLLGNDILYYPLANPTYTQITGTLAEQLENVYQKMLSYDNQTNISQVNNDLPFVISATALKEL